MDIAKHFCEHRRCAFLKTNEKACEVARYFCEYGFDKCPNRPRTREEREQEPQVKLKPRDAS